MPQFPDADNPKPNAFSPDPETDAASNIIIMAAAGIDGEGQQRLSNKAMQEWKGVADRILKVGPIHGQAILRLLNPFALEEGISPMLATTAIEIYCKDHELTVPEIPKDAQTMFEGVFNNLS